MNKSFKRYKIYTFTAAILAVVFTVFITVFNSGNFDFAAGLYNRGTPVFLVIVPTVAIILFFASSFFTLKLDDMPLRYPKGNSMLTVFGAALCGISMIFTVIMQFTAKSGDHLAMLYSTTLEGLATSSMMLKLSLVFAILGAVYFGVIVVTNKANPLLCILSIAWILAVVLRIYYDMTFVITNPVRCFTALALCSAALFLRSEIRYLMGKCSPCFFAFSASITSVFAIASGVSKLCFIFMGKTLFEAESAYFFFEVAIGIYALSRLLRYTEKKAFEEINTEPSEGVTVISSVANTEAKTVTEAVTDAAENEDTAEPSPIEGADEKENVTESEEEHQ